MVYDAKYFFKKFSKIPPKKWATGRLEDSLGRRCVLGHCGVTNGPDEQKSYNYTVQGSTLDALFKLHTGFGAIDVNDGYINPNSGCVMKKDGYPVPIKGNTPRARVLDALKKIIALTNKSTKT